MGRRLSAATGNVHQEAFLFQRVSVAVQRFNAILVHESCPTRRWARPLAIPACVFSPFGILHHWALKKTTSSTQYNVCDAVIVIESLQEFIQFILRPNQLTWPVSLPVGCYHWHSPLPFITQPQSWHLFGHPMERRTLLKSWLRHCSKVVQSVPNAVCCSLSLMSIY